MTDNINGKSPSTGGEKSFRSTLQRHRAKRLREICCSAGWPYQYMLEVELIAERYEGKATIVTSNLGFTEWYQALETHPLLASASLNCLCDKAYCLVLDG